MDSFEINKLIGAVLGTVFVVFSIGIVSDSLFSAHAPETFGYAIESAEPDTSAPSGEVAAGPEPIGPLLASADAAAGESLFRRCAACHTPESGGANKIGPNLWNIVNRPVASHEGYSYSAALKEFAEGGATVWDYDHLDHFIVAPKGLVRGTAMNFPGLKAPADRANLIAYLRTLADSPAPLPEEAATPAAEAPVDAAPTTTTDAPAIDAADAPDAPATPDAPTATPAAPEAAPATPAPAQ